MPQLRPPPVGSARLGGSGPEQLPPAGADRDATTLPSRRLRSA
jgi:hypothetical protein